MSEPAYTKTTGNNTYWWTWTALNGVDDNGATDYRYYHCLRTYQNGITVEDSNGVNGPGSANCTNSLRSGPSPSTGTSAYAPFSTGTVLADGATYEMCAAGWRRNPYIWVSTPSSCPSTTIDRNKPTIAVSVNGTAEYTNNPTLALRIDYADATSPPWFSSTPGQASNWTCLNRGTTCVPGGSPDPNCSARTFANSRTDTFQCQANVAAQPDGRWYFCARSADAAVPDNPSGTNQFVNAFSNNANQSDVGCGAVTLDRAPPAVVADVSTVTATIGQLVTLSASASDPSGVSGQFAWDYGDNTAAGSGASTTHTYTQPGTYVAKATTTDGAGNAGSATRTITVVAPPASGGPATGGPGTGGPATGGPGTGGPGTGGTATGGTTPGPGATTGTSGALPTQSAVTGTSVSQQAGGGGAQTTTVGVLGLIAPRKVTAGRRSMLLAFTPRSAGKASVALLRGARIVAKKGATFGAAGTYSVRLALPKRLRPGAYKLRVTFTPKGSSRATTRTLRLTVVRKRATRRAAAVRAAPVGEELRGSPAATGPQPVPRSRPRSVVVVR